METFSPGKISSEQYIAGSQSMHRIGRFELTTDEFRTTERTADGKRKTYFRKGERVDIRKAIVLDNDGLPSEGIIMSSPHGPTHAIPRFAFEEAVTPTVTEIDLYRKDMSDEEYIALPNDGWVTEVTPGKLVPIPGMFYFSVEESIFLWNEGPKVPEKIIFADFTHNHAELPTHLTSAAD
jgi:hypothetical protein